MEGKNVVASIELVSSATVGVNLLYSIAILFKLVSELLKK